jgi:hypothetical protein
LQIFEKTGAFIGHEFFKLGARLKCLDGERRFDVLRNVAIGPVSPHRVGMQTKLLADMALGGASGQQ